MLDLDEPTEVLVFAFLGNILNLAYNIPFVYLVWKNRSSKNISGSFLTLRFCGSVSWLVYGALVQDAWVAFSYVVTLIATILIGYIKCKERKRKKLNAIEKVTSSIEQNIDFEITEVGHPLQVTSV
jgi:uncharacterized protein with PQ loop repeat